MARGNKKGPEEMGPMTGRGLGTCAGNDQPGYQSNAPRVGRGGGRGNGRGQGQGFGRGQGRGFGHGMGQGNRWRQLGATRTPTAVGSPADSTLANDVAELKVQLSELTLKINTLIDRD